MYALLGIGVPARMRMKKVARVKYGPSAVSASPENEDNDRDNSSAHHSIDSIPVVKVKRRLTFLER
jgi:hypothetical protein